MQTAVATSGAWQGLQCESCGAQLQVAASVRTAKCPYCAAPAVVERPPDPHRTDPAFVLGFVVTEQDARTTATAWLRSTWFTPTAFAKADVSDLRGIYVPAYLYTAEAHVGYRASIGENYTVVETRTDSKGRTHTHVRTQTEWRSLQGRWASYLDEILVTASRGLSNHELEAAEPFDLRALRRTSAKLLSGWIAEEPTMSAAECRRIAHDEAVATVGRMLGGHMPGDHHRDLQYQTELRREDLELVLLPVWVLAVRYHGDRPPVRLLINGQTRKLVGRPPRSWAKIGLVFAAVVLVVALLYLAVSS